MATHRMAVSKCIRLSRLNNLGSVFSQWKFVCISATINQNFLSRIKEPTVASTTTTAVTSSSTTAAATTTASANSKTKRQQKTSSLGPSQLMRKDFLHLAFYQLLARPFPC